MQDSRLFIPNMAVRVASCAALLCGACTLTRQPFDAPQEQPIETPSTDDGSASNSTESSAYPGFTVTSSESPPATMGGASLSDSENYVGAPSLQPACAQPPCEGESLEARGGALVTAEASEADAGAESVFRLADAGEVEQLAPDAGALPPIFLPDTGDAGGSDAGIFDAGNASAVCTGAVFQGACYHLEERPATYAEAGQQCEALGAHLVFLETAEEEQFVVSQLQQLGIGVEASGGTWLGARDVDEENQFVWEDGSELIYENFANTQPDDGEGVQCLELRLLLAGQPLWFDRPCGRLMPFTCERAL